MISTASSVIAVVVCAAVLTLLSPQITRMLTPPPTSPLSYKKATIDTAAKLPLQQGKAHITQGGVTPGATSNSANSANSASCGGGGGSGALTVWAADSASRSTEDLLEGSGFGLTSRIFKVPGAIGEARTLSLQQDWPTLGLSCVVWPAARHLVAYLLDTPNNEPSNTEKSSSTTLLNRFTTMSSLSPSANKPLPPLLPPFVLSDWRGVRIVELGAGNGLVGLALAARGAQVTITDRASVLTCAQRNARSNRIAVRAGGGAVAVRALDWCADASAKATAQALAENVDVIVGSDLVYDEDAFAPLICVLETMLLAKKRASQTAATSGGGGGDAVMPTTTSNRSSVPVAYLSGQLRYQNRFEAFARMLSAARFHAERVTDNSIADSSRIRHGPRTQDLDRAKDGLHQQETVVGGKEKTPAAREKDSRFYIYRIWAQDAAL